LLALVRASLDDDKAEEVAVIDLAGKSNIADFMVVASGRSSRQVGAMAEHLRAKLKTAGVKGISVEGAARADWVLIDGGDIIVHLFRPEVRAFYAIEKMWGEELSTPRERAAGTSGAA
jgi:ribosome-associated protein